MFRDDEISSTSVTSKLRSLKKRRTDELKSSNDDVRSLGPGALIRKQFLRAREKARFLIHFLQHPPPVFLLPQQPPLPAAAAAADLRIVTSSSPVDNTINGPRGLGCDCCCSCCSNTATVSAQHSPPHNESNCCSDLCSALRAALTASQSN
jgi:hypothetical protein